MAVIAQGIAPGYAPAYARGRPIRAVGEWQAPPRRRVAARTTTVYRDGIFALKLGASVLVGAAITLGVMNNLDSGQAPRRLEPNLYETSNYRPHSVPKDVSSLLEQTEAPYPRIVKTVSFTDPRRGQGLAPVASVTSRPPPLALKANGSTLEDMADGSLRLRIPLHGSLQNPAWSADGKLIAFTRFRNGYNKGPADVYVFNMVTGALVAVANDGSDNVSQPGSTWQGQNIVFSSDRSGHDEIWLASADGGKPQKLTSRSSHTAYEPSFSPDGHAVVFESHELSGGRKGRITVFDIAQNRYVDLTGADEDCRQPNWSPRNDYILYQKHAHGRWDIWLYDLRTKQHRSATAAFESDKTDATFSPDGRFLLYSGEVPGRGGDGLVVLSLEGGRPMPMTAKLPGYQGAPSWSPDGAYLAMESTPHSSGASTELIITPVKSAVRLSWDTR